MTRIQGLLGTQRPVAPRSQAAAILGVLGEFDRTQWWPPEKLQRLQFRQLAILLSHAYRNVPFYRQRLDEAGIDPQQPLTAKQWHRIPLLTRGDVRKNLNASLTVPKSHGRIITAQSSGSTGQPVKVRYTDYAEFFWKVLTLREHCWHRRDPDLKFASIRYFDNESVPAEGLIMKSWHGVIDDVVKTGPSVLFQVNSDISRQAAWLKKQDPEQLLTFPSNLAALTEYCQRNEVRLKHLREIRTIGETVSAELRRVSGQFWGVPLVDLYSSAEVGYISLQCPDHRHQHIQSETVLVEVLDAQGRSCRPGEVGRVVLTSLYNFAAPLIRYEIRDSAEVGEPCPCGRGLPVLNRIVGRYRNMLVLPSGEKRWPVFGYHRWAEIAPITQFQVVQRTIEHIEIRLVAERQTTREEEEGLRELIIGSLGHPFRLTFTYLDEIPKNPGGKFEEVISEVGGQGSGAGGQGLTGDGT